MRSLIVKLTCLLMVMWWMKRYQYEITLHWGEGRIFTGKCTVICLPSEPTCVLFILVNLKIHWVVFSVYKVITAYPLMAVIKRQLFKNSSTKHWWSSIVQVKMSLRGLLGWAWVPQPETGSVASLFLVKGSSSFPLFPRCSSEITWLLASSLILLALYCWT